jgi:hypothetical protein
MQNIGTKESKGNKIADTSIENLGQLYQRAVKST